MDRNIPILVVGLAVVSLLLLVSWEIAKEGPEPAGGENKTQDNNSTKTNQSEGAASNATEILSLFAEPEGAEPPPLPL